MPIAVPLEAAKLPEPLPTPLSTFNAAGGDATTPGAARLPMLVALVATGVPLDAGTPAAGALGVDAVAGVDNWFDPADGATTLDTGCRESACTESTGGAGVAGTAMVASSLSRCDRGLKLSSLPVLRASAGI